MNEHEGMIEQESKTPVISIRQLRKDRLQGSREAYSLHIPHLDVQHGEKILITGPSGSGKSTLLDMLGLALKPDAAESFLFSPGAAPSTHAAPSSPSTHNTAGKLPPVAPATIPPPSPPVYDIAQAWAKGHMERLALLRQHVGYVLQTGGLLPFLTIRENILSQHRLLGLTPDNMAEKLADILGIHRLLRKLPSELSVGERQRAAIARALAASPSIVLADEPTAALDPANAAGVLRLFAQAVSEAGATFIMVSHAPEQMRGMGFRRLHVELEGMSEGTVSGTKAVLRDNDETPVPVGVCEGAA